MRGSCLVLAVAIVSPACGGDGAPGAATSPVATPAPTPLYSVNVSDPAGDSLRYEGYVVPDLISGHFEVVGGNLVLGLRFASGSFDPATNCTTLQLDVDQNPATGADSASCPKSNFCSQGMEFMVHLGCGKGTQVHVCRPDLSGPVLQCRQGGLSPFPLVLGPNGMDASVPLSLLADDDGRMDMRAYTTRQIRPETSTAIVDFMPDRSAPMAKLQ